VTQHRPEDAAMVAALPAVVPAGGPRIVALDCFDVRFPTSLAGDGSDAMNPDPDYSAACLSTSTACTSTSPTRCG
jgi:hypothetical protein